MNDNVVMFRAVMERCDTLEGQLRGEIQESESRLRGEIQESESRLRGEIQETEGRLRGEIQETEGRLRGEIQETEGRLRGEIQETEGRLRGEMNEMEGRMDSKFDLVLQEIRSMRAEMVTKGEFMELAEEVVKIKWMVQKHEMQIRKLRKGRKK